MSDSYFVLEVCRDGVCVTSLRGSDFERIRTIAMRYAFSYAQDGPVTVNGIPDDRLDALQRRLGIAPPTRHAVSLAR